MVCVGVDNWSNYVEFHQRPRPRPEPRLREYDIGVGDSYSIQTIAYK